MPKEKWRQAIDDWRRLPDEEKRRHHLEAIPRPAANSMAMEGEPVDEGLIRKRLIERGLLEDTPTKR